MAFRRALAWAKPLCSGLSAGLETNVPAVYAVGPGWAKTSRAHQQHNTTPLPSRAAARSKHPTPSQSLSQYHRVADAQVSSRASATLDHPRRQCQTDADPPAVPDEDWQLEYSGVVSSTVRTLKMVSIGTATLSLLGSPLYIVATMDGQYTAVKIMAASGFTCFGLFTTGLLHWFVGPYVHKLWYHPPSEQVKVQVLSIFARPREIVFNIADVQHPEGIAPLQTFQAKGKTMFVDEATFENKELLERLTPPSPFDMEPGETEGKKDEEK